MPAEWVRRCLTVIASLPSPRNRGRKSATRESRSSRPSSTSIIAIVVVAITLVRLAMSYIVSAVTAGEPGS